MLQGPPYLFYPENTACRTKVFMLTYGFVDASDSGFGGTVDRDGVVSYRMSIWGTDEDTESSNWKEFCKLVDTLETEATHGGLKGSLVILAIDNSTVESCLYKGNSSSPKLFELIMRLKNLELHAGVRFVVSHVSGRRMK